MPESNKVIQIKVERDEASNSLVLKIVSDQGSLINRRITVFLTLDGKIDVQKNKNNPDFFIKKSTGNKVLLNIPDIKGEISLQSDGTILLGKLEKANLVLNTFGDVIACDEIDTKSLKIVAKNITLLSNVRCSENLILQATEALKSFYLLQARNIKIAETYRFYNKGFIRAVDYLSVESRAIVNEGLAIATDIKVRSFHSENMQDQYFNNFGVFLGTKSLSIKSKGDINNQPGGELLSLGELTLSSSGYVKNASHIASKGTLLVDAHHRIVNTGTLFGELGVKLSSNSSIENDGVLKTLKEILIHCRKKLINKLNGQLNAETLRFVVREDISNLGIMMATGEISFSSPEPIFNAKTGKILSNTNIKLLSLSAFKNEGEMTGYLSIATTTMGDTLNMAFAKIKGKAVTLSTLKQFTNHGQTSAEDLLKIDSKSLRNESGGTLSSKATAMVQSQTSIDNAGKAVARNLSFKARSLVNHVYTGEIISLETLTLEIQQQLSNGNRIHSEGDTKVLSEELNNQSTGALTSGRNMGFHTQHLTNEGKMESERLFLTATGTCANLPTGKLHAIDIDIRAGVMKNQGSVFAERKLTVECKSIFDNLLRGIIFAGERLALFSKQILENAGDISTKGRLLLKSEDILKNLKEGRIVSEEDLELLAGHVLVNAGAVIGKRDILIQSGHWFTNELGAEVRSKGDLRVEANYRLDNQGTLYSERRLSLKSLELMHNYQNRVIAADEALSILSKYLDNEGTIVTERKLSIETRSILDNYKEGKILAKDVINLCSASILKNAGLIQSDKEVSARSAALLETLADSKMLAKERLRVIADFTIQNAGLLASERIRLDAHRLLNNLTAGTVSATQSLDINSHQSVNEGNVQSQHRLDVRSNALWNLSAGKITAEEALNIFIKDHLETQGSIMGSKTTLEAGSITVEGIVASLQTLSLNIKTILNQCQNGKLVSEEAIIALARDLRLMGQLMTKGDFTATVDRYFANHPDTFIVPGLLKLMLKNGCDFLNPLNTAGSFVVQSLGDVRVHAFIHVGKDCDVNTAALNVHSHGGIYANGKLTAEATRHIHMARDTYVASQGNMSLKSAVIQNHGEINTTDLILQAFSLFENHTHVRVNGNAQIIAPQINHNKTHGRPRPAIEVAQTCTLQGNVYIYDGDVRVGGQFVHQGGSMRVRSSEYEARIAAEEAAMEAARRRAKRKKRRAICKMALGLGVGAVLTPIVGPSIFASLAKLGVTSGHAWMGQFAVAIGRGAVFGCISSGVAGNNPFQGAIQGGITGGITHGMNMAFFKVPSDALKAGLVAGSAAGIETLIKGGNFVQNALITFGATGISHFVIPVDPNKVDRILNTSEIISETRDAIGRSMIKASAEAAVYHKHLGESLITATLFTGVQAFGGAQGQNIALRQSNRQALLTMYESKVASEKTRVFASKPKLVKPLSSNHPVSKPQGQVVQPSQNNTSFRGTKPPRHATSDVRTRHSTGDEPRHLNARQVRAGSNSLLQKVGEFFIGSAHAGELDDFLPIKRTVPIKGNNVKHSKNKKTGSPATANKSTGHEKDPLLDKNSTTKESSWCTLAIRAFCGDRSPEVLRFQQRNCKSAPSLAKLSDNLQSYRPNKVVKMYGREVREGLVETVTFVSEEATHLFLGETTKTGATIVKVGRFLGEECARLELNEKTKTGQFFRRAATFAREEEARFQSEQPTITGTILSKITAEDIAIGLGRVSGGGLPFGLAGSVMKQGSRVLALTEASEALVPLYNSSKGVSRAASAVGFERKVVQESTHTFLQQWNQYARNNVGIHGPIDITASTSLKGVWGESAAVRTFTRAGYDSLTCRLPGNKGLDHVFVRYEKGILQDITLVESKFSKTGIGQLKEYGKGQQMGPKWLRETIKDMQNNSETRETASLLRKNWDKINFRGNVLGPDGMNRWKDLTNKVNKLHHEKP